MDLNNKNLNESIFENTWSNLSEISTLVMSNDNISTCSNNSLCYSESDSDSHSDTNNDILNTAIIDIQLDLDIGTDTDTNTGTDTSPSQNYYFDKISTLTDKYITLNSNLNSTNNRVELLRVSSEYTEYHVNYLYQSLSESKHAIDTLNQDLAIKNEEIAALHKEFKEMKNRMENMELRFENTVAHLRNTVDIHKIDTQNRINSLLIHRPKAL